MNASSFELHGALRVIGSRLCDSRGEPVMLFGMSTHGIAWFPKYIDPGTFRTLRDDWGTNCIRLVLYPHEHNGYCTGGDREELLDRLDRGIRYARELGLYIIVDWHVLKEESPLVYLDDAKGFFDLISRKYGGRGDIFYELCNEPNGRAEWSDIKSFAEQLIPIIRTNDPGSVIIVGTPTWSQDLYFALDDPLRYENIMYSLHFYAATHTEWLRDRTEECLKAGLPVFISEFGVCNSLGFGEIDEHQTAEWFALIEKYGLSHLCWSLSSNNDTSSVIRHGCTELSNWKEEDLSPSGRLIRSHFRSLAGLG